MSSSEDKKQTKLGSLARIFVSAGLLGLVFTKLDWTEFAAVLSQVNVWFLLLTIATMVGERYFAAYRWYVLLKCGSAKPNFTELVHLIFASSFFGMFLPGGSIDVLRVVGHSKKSNDLAFAFSSVLLDRLFGVTALALFTLVANRYIQPQIDSSIEIIALGIIAAAVTTYVCSINNKTKQLASKLLKFSILTRVEEKFNKLTNSLNAMQGNRQAMLLSVILAFSIQLFRIAIVLFAALSLGIDLPLIYYFAFVPVIIFIQLLPISIGGLGTREAAFIYLFSTVAVSPEEAFTLSILTYFLMIISNLPGIWMSQQSLSKTEIA